LLTKRQRLGKWLLTLGVILLLLSSNILMSDLLLGPLESTYPPLLDPAALNKERTTPIRWVAVLGSSYDVEENRPLTARLGRDSLARLVEGVRVQKMLPGSKVLLSVGVPEDVAAQGAREMGRQLGLSREELQIIQGSLDTRDEAERMRPTLGTDEFVLVTSASHMPRAMALFQRAGMKPLPAPTDFWVKRRTSAFEIWFPSADALRASERASYEYLGLLWMRLSD
jgi:uncharacterized SAM-binding protein YcdF (DUF218 family)